MIKKKFLSLLCISIVFGFPSQSQAAPPVVDQSAAVDPANPFNFALGGGSGQILYQSFTVGIAGRLAELRLPIGCGSGEVIVEIFDADAAGLPATGASPRLTRRFAANLFPDIVTIDFEPLPLGGRVGVNPGDRLVMVLSNPTGSCGIAAGIGNDLYFGGTGHAADAVNSFVPVPLNLSAPTFPDDLPFQALVRRTGPPAP